jgi:glycosyltransferase involved in cell wall biosynthesis
MKKILFLSRWFPYPPDNGARIRINHLIKHLSSIASVDLLAFHTSQPLARFMDMGLRDCRDIQVVMYQDFRPATFKALYGLFSMKPRSVIATHSHEMVDRVKHALATGDYDLVIASQRDMVDYLDGIEHPPALLEELELSTLHDAFMNERNSFKRLRAGLTWKKAVRYYRRALREFQATTVVSKNEKDLARSVLPHNHTIEVIPNGIDFSYYHPEYILPREQTLLYCGSLTYHANFDAICYFLERIFPEILDSFPSAKLRVTGSLHGVDLDRLPACTHVEFTGYLEDVRPVISGSWLSIVPLRIGGGTRLKIIESLAMGTPVIASVKGAEGLAIANGDGMLVADSPHQFVQYVLDIFNQPELRQALSIAGRNAIRIYDWRKIGPQFNNLVEGLIQRNTTRVSGTSEDVGKSRAIER